MRRPQLRTPLARAVVPVLGGIGFFAVLGLLLWGAAAYISGHSTKQNLAPTTFAVGNTKLIAETVAKDGPLLFADLLRSSGKRSIVLDHTGDDPQQKWRIYMAYPADRTVDCKVRQIPSTRTFTDCDGRTLQVEQLADPPAGVQPVVFNDGSLELDLLPNATQPTTTEPTTTPTTS